MVVSVAQYEDVAIVTIDNRPVNATNLAVRQKLLSLINHTNSDDTIKAVVLICAGHTFIAGADVKEFDQSPVPSNLPDLITRIEQASKPWIAGSSRKVIKRTSFSSKQIMSHILRTMQREGQKILDEGIAEKAEDIDVIMVNAFGFPRWRGGPMYMLSNPK